MKLSAAGLWHRFAFGVWGDEAPAARTWGRSRSAGPSRDGHRLHGRRVRRRRRFAPRRRVRPRARRARRRASRPAGPRCPRSRPRARTPSSRTSPTRPGPWRRSLAEAIRAACRARSGARPRGAPPVSRPEPPSRGAHRSGRLGRGPALRPRGPDSAPSVVHDRHRARARRPRAPRRARRTRRRRCGASRRPRTPRRRSGPRASRPTISTGASSRRSPARPIRSCRRSSRRAPISRRSSTALETEGPPSAVLQGRRIASLLPTGTPVTATIVLVPFFGVSGFAEVAGTRDGETLVLSADLPRLTGDLGSAPMPREMLLKMVRAASAEAWRTLFDAHVRKAPAWPDERAADFDTLLARTVAEGPPTLFLIPDDFFPIVPLLEEPILRAYTRWNRAADVLLEGKRKDSERQDLFASRGEGRLLEPLPGDRGRADHGRAPALAAREKYLVGSRGRAPRRGHALSRRHEGQEGARDCRRRRARRWTRSPRRPGRRALPPQRTGRSGNAVASGGSSGGCSVHSRSFAYV